jgi:hypothetical protein
MVFPFFLLNLLFLIIFNRTTTLQGNVQKMPDLYGYMYGGNTPPSESSCFLKAFPTDFFIHSATSGVTARTEPNWSPLFLGHFSKCLPCSVSMLTTSPMLVELVFKGLFIFSICFWRTSGSFFVIFSSVAPHRGQPAAKCHPTWQRTRRLAVRCGLGRLRIQTRDYRTTVMHITI